MAIFIRSVYILALRMYLRVSIRLKLHCMCVSFNASLHSHSVGRKKNEKKKRYCSICIVPRLLGLWSIYTNSFAYRDEVHGSKPYSQCLNQKNISQINENENLFVVILHMILDWFYSFWFTFHSAWRRQHWEFCVKEPSTQIECGNIFIQIVYN